MEYFKNNNKWLYFGLAWGFLMYLFFMFVFPLISCKEYGLSEFLFGIPIWIIAGIGLGYYLKIYPDKKRKIKQEA